MVIIHVALAQYISMNTSLCNKNLRLFKTIYPFSLAFFFYTLLFSREGGGGWNEQILLTKQKLFRNISSTHADQLFVHNLLNVHLWLTHPTDTWMCHESHQDLPNVTLLIHVVDKQFGPSIINALVRDFNMQRSRKFFQGGGGSVKYLNNCMN